MSHFAKVRNGKVEQVIVAEQDFIDALPSEAGVNWLETSKATRKGSNKKGGQPMRKNFAGIGYTYDSGRDAFIKPKPFDSWSLDESTGSWQAPEQMPNDGNDYKWDEQRQAWQRKNA